MAARRDLTEQHSGGPMTQQEFLRRRQALLAKMAPASAAVIFPRRK